MSENNLICVLYGSSNTGKTTSLRLLAKKLEQITIASITIQIQIQRQDSHIFTLKTQHTVSRFLIAIISILYLFGMAVSKQKVMGVQSFVFLTEESLANQVKARSRG